ncbi:MAG: hypothetical protein ACKOX6_08530 [Bdellovibrio sp.]
MQKLFSFIFVLLTANVGLAEPCITGSPFKTKALQDVSQSSCIQMLKSKQCQDLFAKMRAQGEKPEEKALKCQEQGTLSRAFEASRDYYVGCQIGGWNFVKNSVVGLGTAIGEGAAQISLGVEAENAANKICDADPKVKASLYSIYNQDLPKLLKMSVPTGKNLGSKSCAGIKLDLNRHSWQRPKEVGMSIVNKQLAGKVLTAEEKEFQAWGRSRTSGPKNINLLGAARAKLKEMGIQIDCYNAKAAAAMTCEAIAQIATSAPGTTGLVMNLARLKNISKIAGVAVDAEKTGAAAMASRAMASASDLKKAASLSNIERIAAAEKALGRGLSEAEKKALIKAHEVAEGTGRGYLTYSSADLKQKADTLQSAGFSKADRELLMRQGLAGSMSNTQAAKNYANAQRLAAERAGAAGNLDQAKKNYIASADSLEVVMADRSVMKTSRDYWVGAKTNANAGRYDKASDYFIKSYASEANQARKTQDIFDALQREKNQLREILSKNSSSPTARMNYETHRKLVEAVANNPQLKMVESAKRELLKP